MKDCGTRASGEREGPWGLKRGGAHGTERESDEGGGQQPRQKRLIFGH